MKLCDRDDLPELDLTDVELAWVAGLLEGEGTFTPHRCKRRLKSGEVRVYSQPRSQFQTQDKDIAERFAKLANSNLLGPYDNSRGGRGFSGKEYKECWVVCVVGKKAAALNIAIYPMMGNRRKEQIEFALKEWGTNYEDGDTRQPTRHKKEP